MRCKNGVVYKVTHTPPKITLVKEIEPDGSWSIKSFGRLDHLPEVDFDPTSLGEGDQKL
jgi:hypothetical protein